MHDPGRGSAGDASALKPSPKALTKDGLRLQLLREKGGRLGEENVRNYPEKSSQVGENRKREKKKKYQNESSAPLQHTPGKSGSFNTKRGAVLATLYIFLRLILFGSGLAL